MVLANCSVYSSKKSKESKGSKGLLVSKLGKIPILGPLLI